MAANAKVDPKGGKVSWSMTITNLMLGIYHARHYGPMKTVLEKWDDQTTDDSIADTFLLKTLPSKLKGGILWWQCNIADPTDKGGKCVCIVTVLQDGKILCQDAVAVEIPPGSGQIDAKGDQISFTE